MPRDKAHFLKMLDDNPNATIGVTLAAKMVASPHGENADVRSITRELKRQYGETLTPEEVRAEMCVGT
jgi:hypothetical protein